MKNTLLIMLAIPAFAISTASFAAGQDRSTEAEALNLLAKVQEYVKANGFDKAKAEFNNLESPFNNKGAINAKGDLYLFGTNPYGVQIVHGKDPEMRGKQLNNASDVDGVNFIREFNNACFKSKDGKGKFDYKFNNPATKTLEVRTGYVVKVTPYACVATSINKAKG